MVTFGKLDLEGPLPHLPKSCLSIWFLEDINFCHLTKPFCYLNESLVTIFLLGSLGSVKKLTWSPLFSPITRLWEPVHQVSCVTNHAICWEFCSFSCHLFSRLMEFWSLGKRKEQTPSTSSQKHTYIFVRHSFPVILSSCGTISQFLSGSDLIPKLLSCPWRTFLRHSVEAYKFKMARTYFADSSL